MGKNKLAKFAEMREFPNVIQVPFTGLDAGDHVLRGNWKKDFFKNDHPLVLELGCGKGEYTVNLAQRYPGKNFVGIDIKGSRIWTGAKQALEKKLQNVAFLRTRIDFINLFFGEQEVDEIWITFPDPQPQKERKRLTSPVFLARYAQLLVPGGVIHLKTDNLPLHEYTLEVVAGEHHELLEHSADIYHDGVQRDDVLTTIQTTYEKMFLAEGMKITYLRFRLAPGKIS